MEQPNRPRRETPARRESPPARQPSRTAAPRPLPNPREARKQARLRALQRQSTWTGVLFLAAVLTLSLLSLEC